MCVNSLKTTVGTVAVLAVLTLSALLFEGMVGKFFTEDPGIFISLFFAMILVIPGYLWVTSRLFHFFTGEKRGMSGFMSTGIVGVFAFLLAMMLMDLSDYYAENWPESRLAEFEAPLILGSILVAWAFYRVGCAFLPKETKMKG